LNSSLGPDSFSCSHRSAQLAPISTHQTAPSSLASYLSPTAWAHTLVNHSPQSSPLYSLASDPHRTGWLVPRPHARGMGWPPRPAGPHAEGAARTRALESNPAKAGLTTFAPAPHALATWLERRAPVPPQPPRRSKPGQLGAFASTFAAPGFKSKERP
jgi:hypothetical protein